MASTNKTPQLGLNQWAAGDSVLREDFNADNAKIEAAIQWVKVKEVVTTAAMNPLILSLEDLDLTQYRTVMIHFNFLPNRTGEFFMRTNGLAVAKYCPVHNGCATYPTGNAIDCMSMLYCTAGVPTTGDMELRCTGNDLLLMCNGISRNNGNFLTTAGGVCVDCNFATLKTIHFFQSTAGNLYAAGATFTIYGMPK